MESQMASEETVNNILDLAADTVKDPIDQLVKNTSSWGAINFEASRADLKLIFSLCDHVKSLPISILPEQTAQSFQNSLKNGASIIERMRSFQIEGVTNPTQQRDEIVLQVKSAAENLLVTTQGWIAFLAYQKGDVQRNIESLNHAVEKSKNIISDAHEYAATSKNELDGIISAAREASAIVGVGHFTSDFSGQAENLETEAKKWLGATVICAALTALLALASFFMPIEKGATNAQIVQYMTSKLVMLAVFLTATVWCGRIYKATKHQAATNNHRANALKSFQAFVKATDDDGTRNAVLLETTRSIFAISPTGYLDAVDGQSDPSTKVVEIVKGIAGPSQK